MPNPSPLTPVDVDVSFVTTTAADAATAVTPVILLNTAALVPALLLLLLLALLVLEGPDDTIETRFCNMKFVLSDSTPYSLSIGVGSRQTKHSTWVAPGVCAIALARQSLQNECKHFIALGAKGEFGSAENSRKQISQVNTLSFIFCSLDILGKSYKDGVVFKEKMATRMIVAARIQ